MRRFFFLLVSLFLCSAIEANKIEIIKEGPIHEAFITQESGKLILEAVPVAPPPELMEQVGPFNKNGTLWISGYWAWSKEWGDYLWVSGVWRRPPPGKSWIAGYWKEYLEGWVWISGFWNSGGKGQVKYIDQPPPDPIDEQIPAPPFNRGDYFWLPGYWNYSLATGEYIWFSGRWEQFNPSKVYVPAHYLWGEDGYMMIPSYWDWPIEERGVAYAAVAIPPDVRSEAAYRPTDVLEPLQMMELLFPYWPNYSSLFNHHFHFHKDLWSSWGAIPPWWNWDSWWGLAWQDQWWLWWWWSHPRYPNPLWLNSNLAKMIEPPSKFLVNMMKKIKRPPNVAIDGVIGSSELLNAMITVTGKENPILPSDPKQVEDIQEVAKPKTSKYYFLIPSGKGNLIQIPSKPFFGPAKADMKHPPYLAPIP